MKKKLFIIKRLLAKYIFSFKVMKSLLNRKTDRLLLIEEILKKPFYHKNTDSELNLFQLIFSPGKKESSSLEEIEQERKLIEFIVSNKNKHSVLTSIFEKPFYEQTTAEDPYHQNFTYFLKEVSKLKSPKILELGARKINQKERFKNYVEYVTFDINEGEGVDVVGDIHKLSDYFENNHFDAVFLISVFEHLALPWKAIVEINKIMKPGGILFISTHPAWPAHALPWDFWRYQKESFHALLNEFTGFKIIKLNEGLPGFILPFGKDRPLLNIHMEPVNLGISLVARKSGTANRKLRWDLDVSQLVKTTYPKDF